MARTRIKPVHPGAYLREVLEELGSRNIVWRKISVPRLCASVMSFADSDQSQRSLLCGSAVTSDRVPASG